MNGAGDGLLSGVGGVFVGGVAGRFELDRGVFDVEVPGQALLTGAGQGHRPAGSADGLNVAANLQ